MSVESLPTYSITDSKKTFLHTQSKSADYIIAEASNTNGFSEKPYRTEFFGIGLCIQGSMTLQANLFEVVIKENTLVALDNHVIRSWHNRTEDNKLLTAFFNHSFIAKHVNQLLFLEQFSIFSQLSTPAMDLTALQAAKIRHLLNEMLSIQDSALIRKNDIIANYIQILLHFTQEYFHPDLTTPSQYVNAPNQLTNGFKKQVALHFREKRKVKDYAELLFVSPKHLSQTIKNSTGKTAGEWIDEMVMLEAKVLLKQTELTVSQIIDQLNFSDTSFFAKFFKKHTGTSPVEYRKGP